MAVTLRDYQRAGLTAVAGALDAGLNRQLFQMATGTGKTVVFAELPSWPAIRAWLDQFPVGRRRMLVIAHRDELLTQAAKKIKAAHPDLLVCIEAGDQRASIHADVVVASIQSLAPRGYARLHRLVNHMTFRLVVVDEAHHAAAETYRVALGLLGFLPLDRTGEKLRAPKFETASEQSRVMKAWDTVAPKDRLLLGVTATPNRSDEVGLSCVFQDMVFRYPLRQAIADGYLVPPVPYVVTTKTSLDAVRITAGEFNQKDLALAVNTDVRTELAVAGWLEHAPGRPTIAFGVDVAHIKAMAAAFTRAGINAAYVSGDMPTDERRECLRAFTDGELTVVCSVMVLTEGTDLPLVSCIIHAAPTQSASLYEQKTGRGLRPSGYKEDCVIIDVVDVSRKHSLVTLPTLYGLPTGLLPETGKSMAAQADAFDQFLKDHRGLNVAGMLATKPRTLAQLQAEVTRVDAMAPRPASTVIGGRLVKWAQAGDRYRLEYAWEGTRERVEVSRDPRGLWEAVLTTSRPARSGGLMRDQRTLGNQITTEHAALDLAEGFLRAERRQIVRMADPNARWRKDLASPGQLELLARMGVAHTNGITKGEANDLIEANKMGRR